MLSTDFLYLTGKSKMIVFGGAGVKPNISDCPLEKAFLGNLHAHTISIVTGTHQDCICYRYSSNMYGTSYHAILIKFDSESIRHPTRPACTGSTDE
jgi:hypothetical protein